MSKGIGYFFFLVTFIVGVSVGLYAGMEMNSFDEKIPEGTRVSDSVQDLVIKKVQKENASNSNDDLESSSYPKKLEDKSGDDIVITVSMNEEKVAPDAKMVIKKTFSKCKHCTVDITEVPKEIINLSKDELQKKYSGWDIENFSASEIVLGREIDANCEDHYVLKEKNGEIAVYNEITEDKLNLVEVISVDVNLFGEEDLSNLKKGIKVYGEEELSNLIEDYNS